MNLILTFIVSFLTLYIYLSKRTTIFCGNIAHGCGIINSHIYTNSLEAFYNSYKIGYRKIEIDLLTTIDNHVVAAHDWNLFKYYTNFKRGDILNYNYILKSKILNQYHIIYDNMIDKLLHKFKDVIIVTDKIVNYKLLKYYIKKTKRIFVEVSSFKNYNLSKINGFTNILLNIKTKAELEAIIINRYSLFGIVIGSNLFYLCKKGLIKLFNRNIQIYVTDIHNTTDVKLAYCNYVSGFYLD